MTTFRRAFPAVLVLTAATLLIGQDAEPPQPAVSVASAPAVVVETFPKAGSTGVDPTITEIRVTFSKDMADGTWSWSTWGTDTFPQTTGKPSYAEDGRTCVLPVKLEPGKTYATWLNSGRFRNFKDTDGKPSVPYLLVFETAAE
ncbi:MAG: Ig-like domain-containing protein [Planctomycetota bacterium]